MKIYVGNLSFDVTEEELRGEFTPFGKVESISIPTDRSSGKPRGFAFVEMPSIPEGQAAITALNGKTLKEMRIEQYSLIYKAVEAMGGIFPKNLCMDMLPMSKAEAIQLRRYITNKLVEKGIYTPPRDWEPYKVPNEVVERVERAAARPAQ